MTRLLKMIDDFWKDAEVISVYTDEQAVEDGVLIPVEFGDITRITRSVLEDFKGENAVEEFLAFINEVLRKSKENARKNPDDYFQSIELADRKYFICHNGKGFTLMKPQDY